MTQAFCLTCLAAFAAMKRGSCSNVFTVLMDAASCRADGPAARLLMALLLMGLLTGVAASLADFDADLAQRWHALLAQPVAGLTLDLFDPTANADEVAPDAAALGRAVIAGCRHRLLTCRAASLEALRRGFANHEQTGIDLTVQLGALVGLEPMIAADALLVLA